MRGLAIHPKSKVALLSINGVPSGDLQLWNWQTAKLQRSINWSDRNRHIAFAPDGKSFLAGGVNDLKAFATKTGTVIRSFQEERLKEKISTPFMITDLKVSPDGRYVLASEDDISIAVGVWDFKSGKYERTLAQGFAWSVLQSANGKIVIYGSEDAWHVHRFPKGGLIRKFQGVGSWGSASVSPDGRWLASTNDHLCLSSIDSGKSFESVPASGPVDFSPSGASLVFYDPTTGEPRSQSLKNLISNSQPLDKETTP